MIKAIIFDYYDVLKISKLRTFCEQIGFDYYDDRILKLSDKLNVNEITKDEFIEGISKLCNYTPDEILAAYTKNRSDAELLLYIKENLFGKYKLSILSNINSRESITNTLTADEIAMFDTMNLSFETGHIKPTPEAYLLAADSVGVSPRECVFVDDREIYTRAANEVGMRTVVYVNCKDFRQELERILEQENA